MEFQSIKTQHETVCASELDQQSHNSLQCKESVNDHSSLERLARKIFLSIVFVKVYLVGIVCQQCEPYVVRISNSSPLTASEFHSNLEVLKIRSFFHHGKRVSKLVNKEHPGSTRVF